MLALLIKGQRNARIADELDISKRTVDNHLYHIFDKLGVSSRIEAALYVLQTGLLSNSQMSGIPQEEWGEHRSHICITKSFCPGIILSNCMHQPLERQQTCSLAQVLKKGDVALNTKSLVSTAYELSETLQYFFTGVEKLT